ncbi:MAG: (E)-4-hydroxy-3-methylbut-2-enyl-diphosphate synthase [Chlamydiota bacterium]
MKYCESIYQTKRRPTREVMVGNVGIGGDNPVRIQSMTTSNTRDAEATVEQIIKLADHGCEIARVTVQGNKEAETCEEIKNLLIKKGYTIPLVADIHFFPPAAMKVVEFIEKVRVNPGNYADKRATFKVLEYDDTSYGEELLRIEEKFTPLVLKCRELKRAMRIGTNHGSLSDRIMNRYGDTPEGMVESALEFARICRKNDYHNFVFSMKSSNPQVMVLAYRLLAAEMYQLGWDYPLHLGVTEAGEGEDGRIKSAMGIGALLLDGLGDTIRVSLTEDPWYEIDPCKRLIQFYQCCLGKGINPFEEAHRDFQSVQRRQVRLPKNVSMHRDGTVYLLVNEDEVAEESFYQKIGCDQELQTPKLKMDSADGIVMQKPLTQERCQRKVQRVRDIGVTQFCNEGTYGSVSIKSIGQAIEEKKYQKKTERFRINAQDGIELQNVIRITDSSKSDWEYLTQINLSVIFLAPKENRLHVARLFFDWLKEKGLTTPVVLNFSYDCTPEELVIKASTECGSLLCDGLGDGLCLEATGNDLATIRSLSFGILQAARMRTIKTEFISCPSCGRTLFDLQEVTRRIKERTQHLPGVKIAIMGCIVNGPGEMADADFGYVGSRPGMIDLYVGKECVEKNIPFNEADDRLIELIKSHDRWVEHEEIEQSSL